MPTADQYSQRMQEILLEDLKADSIETAKASIKDVIQRKKALRALKSQITAEVKAIRSESSEASSAAGQKQHFFSSLVLGKGMAGRFRADEKRRIAGDRDRQIAPYTEVKLQIDRGLHALDEAKSKLEAFIEEMKEVEPPKPKRSTRKLSAVEELERLAGLHEKGLLTDEEFAAAKRKVIG